MLVLRILRIFVPLLLVAAIVAGTVLVLTSRSDLRRSRHAVEDAWPPLRGALDTRYKVLSVADDAVKSVPGPLHQIVTDVEAAYASWRSLEQHDASVASEVAAANDLESLGRQLVAAARVAPRLSGNTAALAEIGAYDKLAPPPSAAAFDAAVTRFERDRNRPAHSLAARVLGYDSIPALDLGPS